MTVRESKLMLSWRTKNDMKTFYSRCVRSHLVTSGIRVVRLSENVLIKTLLFFTPNTKQLDNSVHCLPTISGLIAGQDKTNCKGFTTSPWHLITVSYIDGFWLNCLMNGYIFFLHGATAPSGTGPHYWGFTIILRHTTIDRTIPASERPQAQAQYRETTGIGDQLHYVTKIMMGLS